MSDSRSIMAILVANRTTSALEVQKALSESGAFIKTRLGLNDGAAEGAPNSGLIILELVGKQGNKDQLAARLQAVGGVTVKQVELSV
jgi:hypothetical protein